jgi:hypothetical protein
MMTEITPMTVLMIATGPFHHNAPAFSPASMKKKHILPTEAWSKQHMITR